MKERKLKYPFFIDPEQEEDYNKNGFQDDVMYYTKRNKKNLILKNTKTLYYKDNIYIVYKKYYKDDIVNLDNTKMIYAFIKVNFNDAYHNEHKYFLNKSIEKNTFQTIDIKNYLYDNPEFNLDYTINICNINFDGKLKFKNNNDKLNLYKIQSLYHSDNKFTISYDPSKYSAMKINFPELQTSIRIFKSFNYKISSKQFKNADIINNEIHNFIDKNYDNITYEYCNVKEIENLSLDDFI